MPEKKIVFLKDAWSLIVPYWKSEEKWKAGALLITLILLTLGLVYLQILLNYWYNDFYNSLQQLNRHSFFKDLIRFCYLALALIIMAVYRFYLNQILHIRWRRWLTAHYLDKWLSKQNYYHMQITRQTADNPDQRISEDVNQFIDLTLGLSLGLLNAAAMLCAFVGLLWILSGPLSFQIGGVSIYIPGYMVWAALGYAIIGTYLTAYIGNPLIRLNFNQQRFEADFRFSMMRFRENGEGIAFYRGEAEEKQGFFSRFTILFNNFWQIIKNQKRLIWFTSFYGQAAIIFPFLVAGPRLFTKEISLGGLIQTVKAFGEVQDALAYIVNSYPQIAVWKATTDRLLTFSQRMQEAQEHVGFTPNHINDPRIEAKKLTIKLPDGRNLIEDLDLQLKMKDSLLITGPSGCGKTTLLRTLSGIWPFAEGKLSIPNRDTMMFLPQKPYLPLGSLKRVLCYPHALTSLSDDEAKAVLELCQLEYLCGNLHDDRNWSHILSGGEQQRIGFARAILIKPDFLLMDEPTSSLDESSENYLYSLLKGQCSNSCIVSVGHHGSLRTWHEKELSCAGVVKN